MSASKLIVLVGPTAVGKTAVAVQLATHFDTEIISADSRQVYREMKIGTAPPSSEQLKQAVHHFVGNRSIQESYDAAVFGEEALQVIHDVLRRKSTAIMTGGSGLYIKSVLDGFDEMPDVPAGLREEIMAGYNENGLTWLQEKVKQHDPEYFQAVDQQNPHRLVRALELALASGKPMSSHRRQQKRTHAFNIVKIGLTLPMDELYERIDVRMDQMIAEGLFDEAKALYSLRHLNALQTVGYQEIFGFIDGQYDRDEAVRLLKRNSRHYAKRQMTWFKKDPEIKWVSPNQRDEIVNLASA